MDDFKKTASLFLVVSVGYFLIGITLLEAQTIQLVSEKISDSAIAWSPDSSEVAIGTDKGVIIINASNGKIEKTFENQQFVGARPTGSITDIEWSPDGKRIAVGRIDEMWTVHYPQDIWIIERDAESAKKVTNSQLYKLIAEDSDISTYQSTYYDTPRWTNDGNSLIISVETKDRVEDKKSNSEYPGESKTDIALFDLSTQAIEIVSPGCCPEWSKDRTKLIYQRSEAEGPTYTIDYDGNASKLLPDTKTTITPDQEELLLDLKNVFSKMIPGIPNYDQYVSPDGKKVIVKMSEPDNHYEFIIKDANVP
jgi:WD40 repeat protein